MRVAVVSLVLLLGTVPVVAATVRLEPDRDATVIEDPEGALANGAGPALFAGLNSQGSVRRAFLHFDVEAALPERAIIERVVLTLFMAPSNAETRTLRLHRVVADWGEGPSYAEGGGGADAEPGDVTWLHTFYDAEEWVRAGGQLLGRASAAADVSGSGFYAWGSSPQMAADVRLWAATPARNFGWALLGDETASQSSKNFASREHPSAMLRPVLEIAYRVPGDQPYAPSSKGSTLRDRLP